MVKKNIGKQDTMRSLTARLPTKMANVVRSFFSNLYDSRTNRLATVPTATPAKRNVHRTIRPGVMVFSPLLLEVEVINAAVVKPSETLVSAVLIVSTALLPV